MLKRKWCICCSRVNKCKPSLPLVSNITSNGEGMIDIRHHISITRVSVFCAFSLIFILTAPYHSHNSRTSSNKYVEHSSLLIWEHCDQYDATQRDVLQGRLLWIVCFQNSWRAWNLLCKLSHVARELQLVDPWSRYSPIHTAFMGWLVYCT